MAANCFISGRPASVHIGIVRRCSGFGGQLVGLYFIQAFFESLFRYMKYYLNNSVTWGVNGTGTFSGTYLPASDRLAGNNVVLPKSLPNVPSPVRKESIVPYRYYQNVCTGAI